MSIIRRVRQEAQTPIIVLSARDEERDKIAGLDAGADDYLTKPFGTDELDARIRAVLRRSVGAPADADGLLRLGPVELDPLGHAVAVGGTPVHLTPREFELLRVLMTQRGRVVTKGRLLRAVWGVAYAEEGHYVHVYVNRLRRKLAEVDPTGAAAELIATEPGIGYRVGPRRGSRAPGGLSWAPDPAARAGDHGLPAASVGPFRQGDPMAGRRRAGPRRPAVRNWPLGPRSAGPPRG